MNQVQELMAGAGGVDERQRTLTPWGGFVQGDGEPYAESVIDEDGERVFVKHVYSPTEDGFPSAWHRERYVADLRRSLVAARANEAALAAMGKDERATYMKRTGGPEREADVLRELERLGEDVE